MRVTLDGTCSVWVGFQKGPSSPPLYEFIHVPSQHMMRRFRGTAMVGCGSPRRCLRFGEASRPFQFDRAPAGF